MADPPEQQARQTIDAQLRAAGCVVQSLDELNLSAARGVAVREMQSFGGPADYILFVDMKALGVVEAKKAGTTLSGVAEQSARYTHARKWIPQRWADPLPFTYESTGIETNFRDQRDPDSRSRPVFAFHTPEHLVELVQQPATLRERLRHLAFSCPLITKDLRDCQINCATRRVSMHAAIPPLAEQHQIVTEVEARTTAIDHLEAELNRQITRSTRLRQATSSAAFAAEL